MADIEIGIPEPQRKEVAEGLSRLLADTYTLYLSIHGFHWNVEGPMFQTLHDAFMTQYTELWTALDEIAERIRALGFYAPASYGKLVELTSIESPDGVPAAKDMIRIAKEGHEAVAKTARSIFEHAEKASDEVTVDLLTQRLTVHEKTAWMMRAMLG